MFLSSARSNICKMYMASCEMCSLAENLQGQSTCLMTHCGFWFIAQINQSLLRDGVESLCTETGERAFLQQRAFCQLWLKIYTSNTQQALRSCSRIWRGTKTPLKEYNLKYSVRCSHLNIRHSVTPSQLFQSRDFNLKRTVTPDCLFVSQKKLIIIITKPKVFKI